MSRRLFTLALLALAGCTPAFEEVVHNVIPPEQRSVDYRDPSQLPPVRVPPTVPPRTVSDRRPGAREWQLSLDDAIARFGEAVALRPDRARAYLLRAEAYSGREASREAIADCNAAIG